MDRSTDKSLWDRVCNLFGGRSGDSIEQAVMEARDEGELDLAEGSMILSILRLDDVQVQDIMTPKLISTECLGRAHPVSEVAQCILETGHSRLPISMRDTRDNIIGIAYAMRDPSARRSGQAPYCGGRNHACSPFLYPRPRSERAASGSSGPARTISPLLRDLNIWRNVRPRHYRGHL